MFHFFYKDNCHCRPEQIVTGLNKSHHGSVIVASSVKSLIPSLQPLSQTVPLQALQEEQEV